MKQLVAICTAWWIFWSIHPTQPFLGPFPTEVKCLRAALLVTELNASTKHRHAEVDCRDFSEVER